MDDLSKNRAEFIVWVLSDFAEQHGINNIEAYRYAKKFNGISYLTMHYGILHTQSIEDVVKSLATFCQKNGGILQ